MNKLVLTTMRIPDYLESYEYIDISDALQDKDCHVLYSKEDGIIVNLKQTAFVAVSDKTKTDNYLSIIKQSNPTLLTIHDEWFATYLLNNKIYQLENKCYQVYYDKKDVLSFKLSANERIETLTLDDKALVLNNYSLTDEDYILNRISCGVMSKLIVDNTVVGFIGEHEEKAIGMLVVFPSYQNKGYGTLLMKYKMTQLLNKGKVPYSNIICGNEKSIQLHKKLGFKFNTHYVYWLS